MVVVVADVITVLVLPGVKAVVVLSAHDACTSMSAAEDVIILTRSLVPVRFKMHPQTMRVSLLGYDQARQLK